MDNLNYLKDVLTHEDYSFELASYYSAITEMDLSTRMKKYQLAFKEDGVETGANLANAIINGVTFIFKMVVTCIKYLVNAIKALIVDSGIISKILSLIIKVGESYSMTKIKVTDPAKIEILLTKYEDLIMRKFNKVKSYKPIMTHIELANIILDDIVITDDKFLDVKKIRNANNIVVKDLMDYNNTLRSNYMKYNNSNNAKLLTIKETKTISNEKDRNKYIAIYSDLLKRFHTNIYMNFIDYLNIINKVLTDMKNRLEKLKKVEDILTTEDIIFNSITEVILPHFIIDIKNMTEISGFFKKEIISGLLALTEQL